MLNINSKDEQDIFLQNLIDKHNIKRKKSTSCENSQCVRNNTFKYNVLLGDNRLDVCRNAFLSIYYILFY